MKITKITPNSILVLDDYNLDLVLSDNAPSTRTILLHLRKASKILGLTGTLFDSGIESIRYPINLILDTFDDVIPLSRKQFCDKFLPLTPEGMESYRRQRKSA